MTTTATLILRIGVFGTFLGHGLVALQGNPAWIPYLTTVGFSAEIAPALMRAISGLDLVVAMLVLFKPIRLVLLCAVLWAFATALVRPFAGLPVLVFVERDANWAAPLALLCVRGLATQLAGLGAIIHAN